MKTIPFQEIKRQAVLLGLDDLGITPAEEAWTYPIYSEWLDSGEAGEMDYLARYRDERRHPRSVLPGVKTLFAAVLSLDRICLENPPKLPVGSEEKTGLTPRETVEIIPYAFHPDYHQLLRGRLRKLATWLKERLPEENFRSVADTAPILEKEWAVRAGLGTIGKNSLLLHPKLGSALFLGILLTTAPPETFPNLPEKENGPSLDVDPCANCDRCVTACPAGALRPNRTLSARKCLNYWLIEYRGEKFPEEVRAKIGRHLFGCDICQRACPKNPRPSPCARFSRSQILEMSEEEFHALFDGTPVKRLGLSLLKRNARAGATQPPSSENSLDKITSSEETSDKMDDKNRR